MAKDIKILLDAFPASRREKIKLRTNQLLISMTESYVTQLSELGRDFIARFEGLRFKAYQDVVGVWTIGYGHTKNVKPGQVIIKDEALSFLSEDAKESEVAINKYVTVSLEQNEYDALVSFVFNVGAGAFERSTLLRLLNQNDRLGVYRQFGRWNKAGGQVVKGLTIRREAEARLFQTGKYS